VKQRLEIAFNHFLLDEERSIFFGISTVDNEWESRASCSFNVYPKTLLLNGARAVLIERAGDQLLAGAALAANQHGHILRRAERFSAREREAGREVAWFVVGRKAETYFRYRGIPLEHVWTGVSDQPRYADAVEIIDRITKDYMGGTIDRVWLCFTDFRSALSQVPSTVKLVPVDARQFEGGQAFPPQYMFEPDPLSILDRLIPRYLEHRMYAGLLESSASEHASRQRAMKAATDNAGEIIEDLTRAANNARQAAITTEISEIVGGAEALAAST
jgi:F-type H+-transporting ATPase subunit gamma